MSQVIDLASLSRFAARALAARPALAAELVEPAPFTRTEMAQALDGAKGDDETALKRRLRRLRERVLLRVMARDLVARAPREEVCAAMSALAELAFTCALDWLGASDLVIVGMGKLGGRELNVSSDVDLVFLHPDAAGAQRLEAPARRLSRLLAELTEDGFVFRVDLRLRPYGDSGPLVCSYDFLESYFVAQGREWERYAWIKARALTGSQHEALAQIVRPFVYRKYLDYATLDAMRRLHAEVRRDVERRELAEHVKLGPGGIRVIEFVAQALQLVRGGRDPALTASQRYAALPEDSRRRLDRVVPALARAAARTADPDATLARGIALLEAIASRAAYLALLAEHPDALERVARIISSSSWAAEFITRHPLLLDELLDDRLLYAPPDLAGFAATLRARLADAAGDTERRMNLLREAHQAQVFRLLAQDLAGLLTVERLADHLSALADLVLELTLECAWADLPRKHRAGAPQFAVSAYGKLGGKELGYASDLDIIFLYDDAHEQAGEVYARLAQRLNTWLSSRTTSGVLFETDLELRPSGASGLLVSSLAGFEQYQETSAWVWEHQALTRARYCAGDRAIGEAFEGIRTRILTRERDPIPLATEIAAMREKLHTAHPNARGLFDLKHDRGGMIDLEFAVHFLVLANAHRHRDLTDNLGNIALLKIAAGHGRIDLALAERCREAYREFRRLQHALRLNGAQYASVPRAKVAQHGGAT